DFLAVDGEGLVVPLANCIHRGIGEFGAAADRSYLLNFSVGANQGLESDGALDVGAAGGIGVFGLDAVGEKGFGKFRLEANEGAVAETGCSVGRQRFG